MQKIHNRLLTAIDLAMVSDGGVFIFLFHSFKNEFPESKYMKEVENIYKDARKYVKELNE